MFACRTESKKYVMATKCGKNFSENFVKESETALVVLLLPNVASHNNNNRNNISFNNSIKKYCNNHNNSINIYSYTA